MSECGPRNMKMEHAKWLPEAMTCHLLLFYHESSSVNALLNGEEVDFFNLHEDSVIEETTALLKSTSQSDIGRNYKLGKNVKLFCAYKGDSG